jgi:site-specific recombinase XerD
MHAAIALFLDHHVSIERRLAPKTLMNYGRDFTQFAAFLARNHVRRVSDVVGGDVRRYLKHLTRNDVGCRTQARYLSSILTATRRGPECRRKPNGPGRRCRS